MKMTLSTLSKFLTNGMKDWLYESSEGRAEIYIFRNLKNQGYSPTVIIDIGAYEGEWSNRMSSIFPESDFILVEPLEDKQEKLNNTQFGPKDIYTALLSDESGLSKTFFQMETGSSYYPETTDSERSPVELKTTTCDELLDSNDVSGGLLKLDTQGAELDILRGAKNVLNDVTAVYLEMSLVEYNKGAPKAEEVISFLTDRGFRLFDIGNRHRRNGRLFQVDLLFIDEAVSKNLTL